MTLDLATIAYNKPRLVAEQIRLLRKHLADPFTLLVLDNSVDKATLIEIQQVADGVVARYERAETERRMHHEALNLAAQRFRERGSEFFGFLDHDVFPMRETRVLPLVEEAGFWGIGQRCPGNGKLYLWPGLCFFSAEWLGEREIDFGGAEGGDTGSAMWPLFAEEDWHWFYRAEHGYRAIREPDGVGLQSWGIEIIGDWLHLSNGAGWMTVPRPEERERLVFELLESL